MTQLGVQKISFEVDHLDEALTEGWSVLMSAEGRVVSDPTEQANGEDPWRGSLGRR